MRFDFRPLPDPTARQATPRPIIDVWLEGIEQTPFACLVDTGALRTRFQRELAEIAGIDLSDALEETFQVGGMRVAGLQSRVALRIGAGEETREWEASVWFCDPWPWDFQLLGLEGFLRHFRVTIDAYEEWVDV